MVELEALRRVGGGERQGARRGGAARPGGRGRRRPRRRGRRRARCAPPRRSRRPRSRRRSRWAPGRGRRAVGSGVGRRGTRAAGARADARRTRAATGSGDGDEAAAATRPSTRGSSSGSGTPSARNAIPPARQAATAGSSSRRVRARTARLVPSRGQAASSRGSGSVGRRGGEDEPAARVGARPDRLGEPLPVVLDQADRALDDGRRAAVVDGEVDAPQAGQVGGQAQHPAHVGEAPAVDRLVVVADEEDPVRRRRQQQGEPQLAAVDVLDLVDQQVGAARAPAREQRRVGLEQPQRARRRGRRSRARRPRRARARRRRRPARRARASGSAATSSAVTPTSSLSREKASSRRRRAARVGVGRRSRAGPVSRSRSGSTARPASRRISRPRAWKVRTRTAPGARPSGSSAGATPLAQLLGGALVEGDRRDRRRVGPASRRARRRGRRGSSSCRSPPARCTGPARAARWPPLAGRARAGRAARRRRRAGQGEGRGDVPQATRRHCPDVGATSPPLNRRSQEPSGSTNGTFGRGPVARDGATVATCSCVRSAERERVGGVPARALASDRCTRVVRVILAGGAQCGSTDVPRSC